MEIFKTQFKGIHNWNVPTLRDKVKLYKGKNVKKGGYTFISVGGGGRGGVCD